MKIVFESSFKRDLKKIKDRRILLKVKEILESFEKAKTLADLRDIDIRKMRIEGKYYRVRIGDYRIGIEQGEKQIIFVRILHRKEIYRYFP